MAIINNNINIVKLIINHLMINVNLQDISSNTPLNLAIYMYTDNIDIINLLLNHQNINVNLKVVNGNTPLHLTILHEKNEISNILINHINIDVNIQNNDGNTPLHLSILDKKIYIIEILINHTNINVNIQNNDGDTPLHLAFSYKYISEILINHINIDVNIQNNNGNTPLHLAILNNGVSEILINHINIDVNIQNNDGNTPLHLAIVFDNDYEIIKKLINKTNLSIINNYNNSILSLYCNIKNNEQKIIILILNKYIENNINITANEYLNITCWSTINNITLSIFNDFITNYHNKFPDLKLRSDKALEYYNIFTNENNNKQYIISAHGKTLNNYFIIPSNMMIIMQTPIDEFAHYNIYNKNNSNNIIPPCFINKNYEEYIKSTLKINPYVYISGSLMKNNMIIFHESDKTNFFKFNGILNIEQITKEDFKLPELDIDFIDDWTNLNLKV